MAHQFERGFKAWADRIATSIRGELELEPFAPLPPLRLASYLRVPVINPEQVPGLSGASISQLLNADAGGWSAVTCQSKGGPVVVFNSAHAPTRQSTDIMHELAHILQNHSSGRLILSQNGKVILRNYDEKEEAEADWLAGALLLPREALLHMNRLGISEEDTCRQFVVSRALLTWRLNATGVLIQAARTRRRGRSF